MTQAEESIYLTTVIALGSGGEGEHMLMRMNLWTSVRIFGTKATHGTDGSSMCMKEPKLLQLSFAAMQEAKPRMGSMHGLGGKKEVQKN